MAGSRFEETADVLSEMRHEAMGVGADTIFSVSAGMTARSQGDLILELDPKNKPRVYSSHVVTGLAARCNHLTTEDTKPPERAYGYPFGESSATDEARCREQGSLWFDSPARCQGTPQSHRGTVKFGFCSDRLCKLEVFGYVGDQNRADTSLPIEFVHASDAISKRYGLPSAQNFQLPSGCSGRRLLGCVGSSKASYTYQWQWKSGESIQLLLTADGGRPAVRLVYDVSRVQAFTIDLNGPPS